MRMSLAQRMACMLAIAKEIFLNVSECVLKGGTALLFSYNLPRYSEDIDLDMSPGNSIDLTPYIKKAMQDMGVADNLEIDITKDTERVKNYMVHYQSAQEESQSGADPIKIDCSMRREIDHAHVVDVDGVRTYTVAKLAEFKTNAFTERLQGRDFFDVAFLAKQYPEQLTEDTWNRIEQRVNEIGIEAMSRFFDKVKGTDVYLVNFNGAEIAHDLQEALQSRFKGQQTVAIEEISEEQKRANEERDRRIVELDNKLHDNTGENARHVHELEAKQNIAQRKQQIPDIAKGDVVLYTPYSAKDQPTPHSIVCEIIDINVSQNKVLIAPLGMSFNPQNPDKVSKGLIPLNGNFEKGPEVQEKINDALEKESFKETARAAFKELGKAELNGSGEGRYKGKIIAIAGREGHEHVALREKNNDIVIIPTKGMDAQSIAELKKAQTNDKDVTIIKDSNITRAFESATKSKEISNQIEWQNGTRP